MSIKVLQERLSGYRLKSRAEEENALKEITQEIALSGLSRAGFFKVAAFQGGTCLRILYGLDRFSEDLDFALHRPDRGFRWDPYLASLKSELDSFGYQIEIQDRSASATDGRAVKIGFIKDRSLGKLLLAHRPGLGAPKGIRIKLEVDTDPPDGAGTEQKYVDFPVTVPVVAHDPASLLAGKSHALLCRRWEKGRDWYDFAWYVGRKTPVNFELLGNALKQVGPWKGRRIQVDRKWYLDALRERVRSTDWTAQRKDVLPFLKEKDLDLLDSWSTDFFLDRVRALEAYLTGAKPRTSPGSGRKASPTAKGR